MDDLGQAIYGGAFFVVDIIVLYAAFSSPRIKPFSLRACLVYFCIVDLAFNTVHIAQGLGYEWATPELRYRMLTWVIVPQLVVGLFAWITLGRSSKKSDIKDGL
jgi:hypothetical protein